MRRARSGRVRRVAFSKALRFFAAPEKLQHHLAAVPPRAMFGNVDSLPGAERHFPAGHR